MSTQDWNILRTHNTLKELCDKENFRVVRDTQLSDGVKIITSRLPYAPDTIIYFAIDFRDALGFMRGYAQRKFEEANNI